MKNILEKDLDEIKKICNELNTTNKKYVIAVANALVFSQSKNSNPKQTA